MLFHYYAFKRALAEYKQSGNTDELIKCFVNLRPAMNSYDLREMFSKPDVRKLLDYLVYHIMN